MGLKLSGRRRAALSLGAAFALACAGAERNVSGDGRITTGVAGGSPAAASRDPGGTTPPPEGATSLARARMARVVFPDGRSFLAEVASAPEARERGLMFRDRLGDQEGMVFLFDEPGIYPFWMKNTRISLDIIWLDREGKVVHLERAVPPCRRDPCPTVVPLRPATWVLEVAAGQAAQLRLGDRLVVGPEGPNPGRASGGEASQKR